MKNDYIKLDFSAIFLGFGAILDYVWKLSKLWYHERGKCNNIVKTTIKL